MGRFYNEYLRDMDYNRVSKAVDKVHRKYATGGDVMPLDEDGNEKQMPKIDTANSIITNNGKRAMTSEEAAMHYIDSVDAVSTFDKVMHYGKGLFSDMFDDSGSGIETHELNLKGKEGGKSSTWEEAGYEPEGTEKDGKYLHYTEDGPQWLDEPVRLSFEQRMSEGLQLDNPNISNKYEYVSGKGWVPKEEIPAVKGTIEDLKPGQVWYQGKIKDVPKKRKKEELIKLPSRPIEQISTSEGEEELKKLPPFELVKNNSSYFTIESKGIGTHTYPKGEDGKVLINLKDPSGRVVWSGTQTEYEEKYGDFLERGDTEYGDQKKNRFYLKEYGLGGTVTDQVDPVEGQQSDLSTAMAAVAQTNNPLRSLAPHLELGGNPYDGTPQDSLKINKMPTDNPTFTPIDPDSGEVIVNVKEPVKLLVNKHGWADIDEYRKKSKDTEFIKGTQEIVITDGFDIDNDGVWGNKTYNAINQDLVNQQLNTYTNKYFTNDQFSAQIYKESTGDNNKVSSKGAMGIAQFLPSTFKWAKEKGWIPQTAKITDKAAQALAQRRYMDYIYEDRENVKSATTSEERQARTFAAYNMGPGNFDKFWKKLSAAEKKAGWETWYKKANNESKMYVLWNMDRATYKKDYSTPYKHKRGYMTSKWNDVNYGFDSYMGKNLQYRY